MRRLALANYLFLLLALAVIAAIISAAMAMQYGRGELPCPLCLLQRAAMFGVCFGIMQNLERPWSTRSTGLSLLFAVFLLAVASRQTLLDIYPRPGHAYVGSAVLGLHMPVWSVLIALALLLAYALKLAVLGGDAHMQGANLDRFPPLRTIARVLGAYVILLCAVNLVSAFVQCGLGECHTTGYRLLR